MKKSLVAVLVLATVNLSAFDIGSALSKGADAVSSVSGKSDYKSVVSSALELAVKELSNGGFLKNATAKIPLPSHLQTAANLAKKVGGEKWANDLVASMNNAASAAVPGAANVFSNVIKNMSETDVKNVMSGGSDGFTKFLRQKSSDDLQKVFKPIIEKMMSDNSFATAYNGLNSLVKNNALTNSDSAKSLKNLASNLGAGEYLPNENEDLNGYITRKTLDGLFNVMSEKESSLRGGVSLESGKKLLDGILK